MKIYTKTGDKGTTSLFAGTRVPKHHIRIESYGTVDELNANIGMLRDQKIDQQSYEVLIRIQDRLFTIGSMLATEPKKEFLKSGEERLKIPKISSEDIELLETEMDKMNENLPEMTNFILPGGHPTVSYCHIARCVCRRAERLVTALYDIEPFDDQILMYLNRLSDYLFVLARKLSFDLRVDEVKWTPRKDNN
ncbi:MAG TPA: cob(I)yrinic acid a,c-diamide adenosyltransferase [Salinimicrobium sp.]|nr:cob(I)yrinic acid a,c-diamide adenosyltransferase [Salinimicrobium sp.]